ncbi:MAG TPA: hypothetical protein DC031_01315 [Sulfitobacter sp.]|uniref:DUF4376 domain-containing protein n=1 Tax=Sulfitobacter dubius TaxID=218673 RepID=UPI000C6A45C1|nr:hypothetical protein [Sulfitobacter sp.]HBB81926.1 hypothetical protein [Sulfitobacter sp.]
MKYAIIESGKVANLAVADEPLGENWIASETAQIGWLYDGETFTPPPDPDPTADDVNAERDRRLELDFAFNGVIFQRDEKSLKRISGASTQALGAMMDGAQPGDLHWHGDPEKPFGWIARDNSVMQMDAQTMFAFGTAAAAVESRLVFAAKTLREMSPIPDDFAADHYWQ